MSGDEPRYDLFVSYARNPDYPVARALESFLESFHTIGSTGDRPLRVLSVCRDGGDFSLGAVTRAQLPDVIRPYLDRSDKLLVLCSASAAKAEWVSQEIAWFLEKHEPDHVILGVTEEGSNVFPKPVLEQKLETAAWYDFRGARAKKGHPYQDFDEARVQLAADLNGRSAGEVLPLWQRQQQLARKRRRIALAIVVAMIAVVLVVAALAIRNSRSARRAAAAQEASELADRAESYAAAGPEMDVVRAFHLAVRAALRLPAGDPRMPLYVARVFHIAATLPADAVKLQQMDHDLQDAFIAGDGHSVVARDRQYQVRVWDAATGARRPMPVAPDALLGHLFDDGPRDLDEVLTIDRSGTLAAAVVGSSLSIWEIATGRALGKAAVEDGDRPVFSADGRAIITKSRCADETDLTRCCWKLLWKKTATDSDPAELAQPCTATATFGTEETRPKLVYRGRRPVAVDAEGRGSDYSPAAGLGTPWAGFVELSSGDIVAVSPAGWVYRWRKESPLLRTVFGDDDTLLDAKLEPPGDRVWVVKKNKRIASVGLDGKESWSAPLGISDPRPLREARLWETSDDHAFLVTYAYGDEYARDAVERIELWRAGAQKPLRAAPFENVALLSLVMNASGDGGLVRRDGEEEYDYVSEWRFTGKAPPRFRSVLGSFLGFTRDGVYQIEQSQEAITLNAWDPRHRNPAPFRGSDAFVVSFLSQAHDIRETADGITAILPGGQELTVDRGATASRVEISEHSIHGRGASIDAAAQLLGLDDGQSVVMAREADTDRVLGAQFVRGSILGFTKDGTALIIGGRHAPLQRWFVRGEHEGAPDWFADLPAALTGTRMLDDLTLEEISSGERRRARASVSAKVLQAAAAGDAGAAFLNEQFFQKRQIPASRETAGSAPVRESNPPLRSLRRTVVSPET